jgi:hypothetical protein
VRHLVVFDLSMTILIDRGFFRGCVHQIGKFPFYFAEALGWRLKKKNKEVQVVSRPKWLVQYGICRFGPCLYTIRIPLQRTPSTSPSATGSSPSAPSPSSSSALAVAQLPNPHVTSYALHPDEWTILVSTERRGTFTFVSLMFSCVAVVSI